MYLNGKNLETFTFVFVSGLPLKGGLQMSTVKKIVRKVTLEYLYDIVDERTEDLKKDLGELKADNRAINTRIDQIHMRLDQIMHMLTEIKR